MDVQKAIRRDLIKADADALAYTLNTQGLPQYIVDHYGIEALDRPTIVGWDTDEPKDKASQAALLSAAGAGIKVLTEALVAYKRAPRVVEILTQLAIPTDAAPLPVVDPAAAEVPEDQDVAPVATPAPALDAAAQ
jgi:phage gp29-like protein